MPAREHWYNVAILSYSSPKTREMAQRGESIAMTGRIRVKVTYRGNSWRDAQHALGLAVARASRMRLAFSVHVLDNYEPIIRVKVEHLF
jgi:hypothetical protein